MNIDLIRTLLSESATAAIAFFAIRMLKRSYEQRMEDLQVQRDEAREHRDIIHSTLTAVSKRLGENAEIHRQLLAFLQTQNGES